MHFHRSVFGRRRAAAVLAALAIALGAQPAHASVSETSDPTPRVNGPVYAIAQVGDLTVIGGEFTMVGGKPRQNVAAIRADGTLDPTFDPSACVRDHADAVLRDRMRPSRERLVAAALEAREFVEDLPGRVNRLMDAVASGEMRVQVDAIDEKELLRGLHHAANRITSGLLLAALIVGAAMLSRIETSSELFGYPSLAIVCFLVAAADLLVAKPRIGVCPGHDCGWLFVNTSGRRRWCQMAVCGNRAKQAAHARRTTAH